MKKLFLACFLLILSLGTLPIVTAQEADEDRKWWNDRVFYEIFVRSFYDSDGDGIGDFQGLIEKLDYLNDGDPTTTDDLGITGIWLMPISPSPSYHGYDVTDYRGINPDYGTMEDFQQFLEEAQARGIAVIVDLVVNHSSVEHEWFVASADDPNSEYADWYVWADEDPGYRGPDRQVVWHRRGDRYYYGVFWSGMPDLNYTNPAVTAEMNDIARFWLEEIGVDGFRLDAIKHIIEDGRAQENTRQTLEWMADFHDYVREVNPDTLLVGEVWSRTDRVAMYIDEQVDIAFEFDLAEAIIRASSFGLPNMVRNQMDIVLDAYPAGQYATFLSNHDQARVMTQLNGNINGAKVAASVLLTIPGVPFVYYGEEIGMFGNKPDPQIRTPMQWNDAEQTGFTTGNPWIDVNADFNEINVAAQEDDPDSLLNTYRALIHARNSSPALQYGDLLWVESDHRKVLSYLRRTSDETVLVVINMDDEPIENYTLTVTAAGLMTGDAPALILGEGQLTAPMLDAAGGFADYAPVPLLPANSAVIIRLSTA